MIPLLFLLAAGSLTDEMWRTAEPIYAKTLQHPFLKGLAGGSLKKSSFHFYLAEDAKYLRAFGQALRVLASKAPRQEWAATLNRHASEAIETEKQLHES